MDGIQFIREQMGRRPVPILVLSTMAEDGERTLEALEAGAVDFVQKPTALANDDLRSVRDELIEKVKGAARAPVSRLADRAAPVPGPVQAACRIARTRIVVIGISTGGPQALRYLLPQFPPDFPAAIAVVLHMPVGYTLMLARKLDEISRLHVIEASEGAVLEPGTVLLAQAGRHLSLNRTARDRVAARLSMQPMEALHRPSVDVLFRSAAEVYGESVLGVVMTGMGQDGKEGAAWIKAKGGAILTEAEESCVIYGMPRAVVEAGLSDACVPLDRMAKAISEKL
jgi:two-component system chemotaxis response regulator CheB